MQYTIEPAKAKMKTRVSIATGGSCRGVRGLGAWGAVLKAVGNEKEIGSVAGETSKQRMELQAAVGALEALKWPCVVALASSSDYLQNGLSWMASWKERGWKTSKGEDVRNRDLWERLDAMLAKHEVSFSFGTDEGLARVEDVLSRNMKAGAAMSGSYLI